MCVSSEETGSGSALTQRHRTLLLTAGARVRMLLSGVVSFSVHQVYLSVLVSDFVQVRLEEVCKPWLGVQVHMEEAGRQHPRGASVYMTC